MKNTPTMPKAIFTDTLAYPAAETDAFLDAKAEELLNAAKKSKNCSLGVRILMRRIAAALKRRGS